MKKKKWLGLLTLACSATFALGFASCDFGGDDPSSSSASFPSSSSSSSSSSNCSNREFTDELGLLYTLNYDKTSYKLTSIGSCNQTDISIPYSVNGKPVSSISKQAFNGCSRLTSIEIPDSVMSIGKQAFNGCNELTSITVSENNTAYKSIDGNLYTKDGETLLQYAAGKTATAFAIPNGVKKIDEYAFVVCTNLTSIEIPDSVKSIDNSAFVYCDNLMRITISENNTAYASQDGILYNKAKTKFILIPSNLSGYIVIPYGISSIGSSAFYNCDNLMGIEIPDSVKNIDQSAFYSCSSLTCITLPFVGASKDGTDNTHFGYIFGASEYSDNCYYVPAALKTVTISSGNIASSAFYKCDNITDILIGDDVSSIGGSAFKKCSNLTSIAIGDGVETISTNTFTGCFNLTSIVIGNSLTHVSNYAFPECENLTSVYYKGTSSKWDSIYINSYNDDLESATRYYYIENESDVPTDGGNYWHYVDGAPTAW